MSVLLPSVPPADLRMTGVASQLRLARYPTWFIDKCQEFVPD